MIFLTGVAPPRPIGFLTRPTHARRALRIRNRAFGAGRAGVRAGGGFDAIFRAQRAGIRPRVPGPALAVGNRSRKVGRGCAGGAGFTIPGCICHRTCLNLAKNRIILLSNPQYSRSLHCNCVCIIKSGTGANAVSSCVRANRSSYKNN